MAWEIGDRAIWKYEPRGGYGYVFDIPCVVMGFGRARVRIAVLNERTREVKERLVIEKSLVRVGGSAKTREVWDEIRRLRVPRTSPL